ncbi:MULTISPECIES: bifunctional diaminohydroxyphosphoribosylaminopyrimidine deaminase/5-amino-6-(5-phosphoribosylamino)uracil reductase RibD [unclassified Nitrospina]|uniref:bifunctional diaminohydroxyphosphoribosylaminopyrimidine deaminase/5-amino-6-(5-phosphoribosylamino)uracil reductase RibD n=1 Tax=unclassified Nitrospina TaxID=2638683 RepID=UPI003F9A2956
MDRETQQHWMRRALALAARAEGRTSPNPLVGAVIVRGDTVVGEGYHHRAGKPHAEIEALKKAGNRARGADMIVTLEPCCHHGRTPPCTEAVITAGIRRVFVGMQDPNPLVKGKGSRRLKNAGIEVTTGILRKECERQNEVFVKYIRTGLPFVTLKAAVSLDGKIATKSGDSKWITGPEARKVVHQLRNRVDAIVAGSGTVLKDDPQLTTRLGKRAGRNPVRVVLDSQGLVPMKARVFENTDRDRVIYVTTGLAPVTRLRKLEKAGVEVWTERAGREGVPLKRVMHRLAENGLTHVLIEGGSRLNAAALKARIVDKVLFFVAPLLIGGNGAVSVIGGPGIQKLKDAMHIQKPTLTPVGRDWMVEGYL